MKNRIDALLFDMDGLMVDTERLFIASENEIAASYGKTLSKATLFKLMSRKPLESMKIFAEDLGIDMAPEKLLEIRDRMMFEKMDTDLKPMPGLYDILDTFYQKKKLAVVTGNVRTYLDLVVRKLDLEKYFDVVQTSESISHGKPDPEIYRKAMEKLGVRPEHCAVLEDSINGAKAGKNAGCYVIAVPSVYTRDYDFSFADYRAEGLSAAKDHLLAMENAS